MIAFRLVLIAFSLGSLMMSAAPAGADVKLTAENMTKSDFDNLVKVATEEDGTDVGPDPVHDPGKDGRKKLKDEGGAKIIDGDEWQKMTPEQRRDRILELKKTTLAPDVILIVIIPRGDVYALPPSKHEELTEAGLVRRWVNSDYVELPDGPVRLQGKRGDAERETDTEEHGEIP